MTTILQISDTHIAAAGALVSGRLKTDASLRRLVDRVDEMRAQIGPIDAMLISGDLSEDGSADSYAHLQHILAPLNLPLRVIPGNHDAREPLRAAFARDGYLPQHGRLNWSQHVGDIALIGLDTLIEGQGGGTLDDTTLTFLQSALQDAADRPVLLSMHHPPFKSGITFMDKIGLRGVDALADLLSDHCGELRVVCGHIHCMMVSEVGTKIALSAPSPCSSFAFDLRETAPVGYFDREDGFLIHRWDGAFSSVRVSLDGGAGPFPF
jgi:Icc protein